jgi:single-stranded DNA-binding protein
MNSVRMTGCLAGEPKLAPTDRGRSVCDLRLTVDNGPYPAFDIDVSVFDAPARICAERLSKGDRVRVEGELRFRRWRDRAGRSREGFSILGCVEPVEPRSGHGAATAGGPDPAPGEVAEAEPGAA